MKGRVEMGTLAVLSGLALLVLGTSVCDAGLISMCKLRDRLNSTLPACVMNQTDMVARIVCYVEMSSGFNTSAINQTVAPEIHFPALGRPNKRHRRAPPGSSSKESNDETFKKPKNGSDPKPSNPAAVQKGNGSSPSELKSNYTETPHHNSSAPGNGSNSAHNPGMVPRGGSHPRHDRSHGSTNEQRGKGGKGGKGGRGTSESSEEESGEESSENILWTLYGLFQLPDRIACTSGATPSLNLCNVTCDSFLNDDITDDIDCLGTLLNKTLSEKVGTFQFADKGPIKKYFDGGCTSCKNVTNLSYFSTC